MTGKRWLWISLLLGLALTLGAACGDDDDDDDDAEDVAEDVEEEAEDVTDDDDEQAADGEIIDISGVEELEDGTLQILSDIPYAPIEFFDENDEVVGVDPDIAAAISEKLGVDYEFIPTGFDAIIPALNAGDGDVIMSAMTINPERDEEVDFVPYLNVGTGIAVQPGNPEGIEGFEDLCGLAVSVQAATIQEEQLNELNENECADNQISISAFPEQPIAEQELSSGNVDAMIADYPVVFAAAEADPDNVEALDLQELAEPYGIAYRTDSPLGDVLQAAFDAIVEDGTYDAILEEWELTSARLE